MGNTNVRVISKTRNIDERLGKILNEQRKQGKHCDYTLKTENGDEFPVHKVLLESVSGFFGKLFNNEFKDSKLDTFVVKNCTSEILKQIIEFMYTNEIELSSNNIKEITDLSLFLSLPNLIDICLEYLTDNINIDNCFELLIYSNTIYCGENFTKKCIEKIFNNLALLIESKLEDFKTLEFKFIYMLVTYDKKDTDDKEKRKTKQNRQANIDKFLYIIVVSWANHDVENREKYLAKLLSEINFDNIDYEYRCTKIFNQENPFFHNKEFLLQMFSVLKDKWDEDKKNGVIRKQNKQKFVRALMDTTEINLYGIFGNHILAFNTEDNHFDKLVTRILHKPKNFAYTTFDKTKILFCGGTNWLGLNTNDSFCYVSSNDHWIDGLIMNKSRSGHEAIEFGNKIYVCGGTSGFDTTVEVFDTGSLKYTKMSNELKEKVRTVGLCKTSNRIYAINFECFQFCDPREGEWCLLDMKNHCSFFKHTFDFKVKAIAYNNFIYRFDCAGIDMYDTRMNRWLDRRAFINDNSIDQQFELCLFKDKIYMLMKKSDWRDNYEYVLHSFDPSNVALHNYRDVTSEVGDYNWGLFSM